MFTQLITSQRCYKLILTYIFKRDLCRVIKLRLLKAWCIMIILRKVKLIVVFNGQSMHFNGWYMNHVGMIINSKLRPKLCHHLNNSYSILFYSISALQWPALKVYYILNITIWLECDCGQPLQCPALKFYANLSNTRTQVTQYLFWLHSVLHIQREWTRYTIDDYLT